jgi:hypothetical protein
VHRVDRLHDEVHSEPQQDRGRDQQEISQKRHRSERHDRNFVRRALRQGVPAQEIEDRLLAATDFHRLNPERDSVAYVRTLIEEEDSGLRNLEVGKTPAGEAQTDSPTTLPAASHEHARQSETVAQRYIQENFEATDWLALVVRNRETGETLQRITTAEQIASPEFQSWLRYKNAHGSDIYLSLNTLKEHAHGRTKGDVKTIRHLYLDLDNEGQQKLAAIYQNPAMPHPNYVLQTSADKYQVIWRVEGIPQNQAEEFLRGLAQRFGGDPAATDATRVFRLPGFNNKKHEQDFPVNLAAGTLPEPVYHRSDFKIESVSHEPGSADRTGAPAQSGVHAESPSTQSERDWAYAIRHLRQGDAPEDIVREIAAYRATDRHDPQHSTKLSAAKKSNPRYYAELTVGRAMTHLGMASRPVEQHPDQSESRLPDVEPNR